MRITMPALFQRKRLYELFLETVDGLDMTEEDYTIVWRFFMSHPLTEHEYTIRETEAKAIVAKYKRKRKNDE